MKRLMKGAVLVAVVVVASAQAASAQSIFSGAGLGYPVGSEDGRARALGGVGIGLMGADVSPSDPAALALLVAPTAIVTSQPSWVTFDQTETGESGSFQNTRFPMVGVAYPAWKLGMMSVTFGSVFDQRFEARRDAAADLSGGAVDATDTFVSEGGSSRLNLSVGRMVSPNVAVGLTVGRYSGRIVRRLVRELDSLAVDNSVQPFQSGGLWSYSGTSVTGGVSLQFSDIGRVAGSVTWSGDLNAEASEDTPGRDGSYAIPLHIRVGGSALLAPGLMLAAGYSSADWSGTAADVVGGVGQATNNFGVGIELTRAALLGRSTPLRLGYRSADLPFGFDGTTPTETAFTAGMGIVLNEQAGIVLASMDIGLERGERKDSTLAERFWRATLTLRVAGF